MIASIEGILEIRSDDWAIIKVGGVGLQIHLPSSTLNQPGDLGKKVQLHTHLNLKEDNISLYGFLSRQEIDLFKMLTSVNGIGPKVALVMLSHLDPGRLVSAIASEDVNMLTRLPGVGKKTAQRLVLELKTKVEKLIGERYIFSSNDDAEVITALTNLGYSTTEAMQTLAALSNSNGLSMEEKISLALQQLAKKL